ncbi:MAG TPA: SDR family NAD(P)-dependent oxidoreductase [Acidimicrobiales bacterium]|nr:SDR family NAD(P)-dependent oxidoreductase [Acidimicrobiales bacterium]
MGVALVTGAGRGLGRAIATRLAADGHVVHAVDIDRASAEETAEMVGGTGHVGDVGDAEAVGALADEIGPVQILINNAGIWRFGPILESSEPDLVDVLRVNLLGTVHCCQAFSPGMAESGGGSIVNLSSAAAAMHASGVGIYPASKGAIELLTQQLAVELGPRSIRVNAVGPGLIVTEGTAANYEGDRQRDRARAVPLQRVGEPTDIANVVAFLASDQSAYVSGQVIYVDGGITAGRPSV